MDWENESYVRLYVRDTPDWDLWPWQARALFPLWLRRFDRSGLFPARHGVKGIAASVKLPLEVVEVGLSALLVDGCIVLTADGYLLRNYLTAQEAKKSDKQRARDSRTRRRDKAAAGINGHKQLSFPTDARGNDDEPPHGDEDEDHIDDRETDDGDGSPEFEWGEADEGQAVTNRDAAVANVALASQPVTLGTKPSQRVTLTSALPIPDQTLPPLTPCSDARARDPRTTECRGGSTGSGHGGDVRSAHVTPGAGERGGEGGRVGQRPFVREPEKAPERARSQESGSGPTLPRREATSADSGACSAPQSAAERVAQAVSEQFWAELGVDSGSDPEPLDRELLDRTAELLAEGYTRRQLVAVAWVSAGEWAKNPRQRHRAKPTWALKPTRLIRLFGRGRPVSDWLDRAAERWREENGPKPPPWVPRPAPDGAARLAEVTT